LFDGWTGKTPMTHLNEYVQRQASWHKPSYNVHGNSSNGYTCSVRLSKTDVKNRSAALAVEFRPPGGGPKQRTAVEAKHVAATYALYRMRSDTSLYLSLPPVHRAYWEELKSGREAEWMYAADPFAAKAERDRVREKGEAERARREEKKARAEMGHREELLRPALRRRWDEMAEVRMAEPHRLAVEEVVRSWTRQWDLDRGSAGSGSGSGSGSAAAASASGSGSAPAGLLEELVGLGFCRAHVLEALGAARTRDGAVDWLCVHLPEDDLPQRFLRRLEAPRVVVHDGGVALAARRLRRCGFPQAAVESALGRAAASQQDASDAAAIEACAADLLVAGLCGRRPAPVGPAVAASEDALAEEAEALRMIFFGEDDRVVVNGGRRGSLSVRLRP
ncbi:helicase, partial [Coemansia sp. RSA 2599]